MGTTGRNLNLGCDRGNILHILMLCTIVHSWYLFYICVDHVDFYYLSKFKVYKRIMLLCLLRNGWKLKHWFYKEVLRDTSLYYVAFRNWKYDATIMKHGERAHNPSSVFQYISPLSQFGYLKLLKSWMCLSFCLQNCFIIYFVIHAHSGWSPTVAFSLKNKTDFSLWFGTQSAKCDRKCMAKRNSGG